jgi:hypothetical protein
MVMLRRFCFVETAMLVLLTYPLMAFAATGSPADRPVQDLPLGVYWPWERTQRIAKNAGLDPWAFTKKTCELLKQNGVDSIWLVNIDLEALKPLLKTARPLGLKLVPCLSEIDPRNLGFDHAAKDFHAKAMEHYARRIPEIVRGVAEDRAALLAWVLADEPTGPNLRLMDPMREVFAKADPEHPVVTVSMWSETPVLIAKTRLTTFCVDVYPFFGPNDPNGPNTPAASRGFYTANVRRMVEAAGRDGRAGWVMPQCFVEIWGPRDMTPGGVFTALPGAYVHWRTPTPAEMRWQIWEGLRLGVKGMFFFVLLGQGEGHPKDKAPEDAYLRPVLVKEPTRVGYDALLDATGNPTPEGSEAFALFQKLAPHKALLRRLVPTGSPWLTADGGAQVGCYRDPGTGERYAVVVNPDFAAAHDVTLTPAQGTRGIADVLAGTRVGLTPSPTGGGSQAKIRLQAGDGSLLKIEQ